MPQTKTTTDDLRLPDGPGFVPHPTPPSVDMILDASEEFLPVWNGHPKREEERLRMKCHVPFVLTD
jgi:hypothetical protein